MGGIAFIIVAIGFVILVFVRLFFKNSQSEQECIEDAVEKKIHKEPIKPQRKAHKVNDTSKPKTDTVNVKIGKATLLGGVALAHQVGKHHKHSDTKGFTDDRLDAWDDGMDELYDDETDDIYDNDDSIDYDYERAAYEEQIAYDDYLASMDMDDN